MAVKLIEVPALDPLNFTGSIRELAGIGRTGDVTLDTYYGENGSLEFARWVYVGTSGNISFVRWDGVTQQLFNLAAGVFHPIHSIKINTTGTTALNIVWGS